MAKWNRKVVGSVLKDKDPSKPDYIKISDDIVLKKGQCLNLESKKSQLAGIDAAEAAGKLPKDVAAGIRENINKMPDFVRFNIVRVEKQE